MVALFSLASYKAKQDCLGVKLVLEAGSFDPSSAPVLSLHTQIAGMYVEKVFRTKTKERFEQALNACLCCNHK